MCQCWTPTHVKHQTHIQSEMSVLHSLYVSNIQEPDNHMMNQQVENDLGHHIEQAN